MAKVKEKMKEVIESQPDDATYEEILHVIQGDEEMLTVRLPKDLEKEIEKIAVEEKTTKSQVIKNALKDYIKKKKLTKTPYELGKDLFEKSELSEENLSKTYKRKIKEKLIEKYSH